MRIGFLGNGVFGAAIGSLVESNEMTPEYVDVGDTFTSNPEVLFVAVPVQFMRAALQEHADTLQSVSVVVNLSKGIEMETGLLPHQIISQELPERSYACVAGPSFANEVVDKMPTTVSVAGTDTETVGLVTAMLQRPYFVLEELGTIRDLELAAAMKNIYAVASGYVAGSGGGKNTHAHVQVVALREFTQLAHALEGTTEVVRPGVVGDLILTCGSEESRNYQYGYAMGSRSDLPEHTAEGVGAAKTVGVLCAEVEVSLPLACAVESLVQGGKDAHAALYKAIGFDALQ